MNYVWLSIIIGLGLSAYYLIMNINCVESNLDLILYLATYVFILFVPIIIGIGIDNMKNKKKFVGGR